MPFTFVALVKGENDSGSAITTLDAAASLNVQAGDLLVTWAKHEGAATGLAVAKNSGTPTNAHTFDAADYVSHSNNDLHGSFGYVLSAAADSAMTPRLTLSQARPYVRFLVMQFRPDAGDTVTKSGSSAAAGNGGTPASGNFSPSGADLVACGGYGEYSAGTTSNEQINGVAAIEPTGSPATYSSVWYRLLTAGFTGQASASISPADWVCGGIAFASAAGGGGGGTNPVPRRRRSPRGLLPMVGPYNAGQFLRRRGSTAAAGGGDQSISVSDAGAGADALAIAVGLAIADAGSGVDQGPAPSVVLALSDSGVGADALTIGLLVSITDSGGGADTIANAVLAALTEAAAGSDAIAGISVSAALADSGAGADSLTLSISLALADAGTGSDAVSVLQTFLVNVADAGAGADAIGVAVSVPVADSGSGADQLRLAALLAIAEAAGGIDVVVRFDAAVRIATITFSLARRSLAFLLARRAMAFSLASRSMTFQLQ